MTRRLDAAGACSPRTHSASYVFLEALRVVDIWDTAENFKAFGATLVPILTALGVTLPEPEIMCIEFTVSERSAWSLTKRRWV